MIPMASEELSPLAPAPAEIALSVVGVATIVFCLFVCTQMVRGRWAAGPGIALIVMAFLLPVVGPLLGYSLMVRARRKFVAASS